MPRFEIDVPASPCETLAGVQTGITIRQLGTLMAMQGLLAAGDKRDPKQLGQAAQDYAEAALMEAT